MNEKKFNQIEYINDFNKKHYKRYTLSISLNEEEVIQAIEEKKQNKEMNKYILELIKKDLNK